MPDDNSSRAIALTIIKKNTGEWLVEAPDRQTRGLYRNAAAALQVAAIEALAARERGLKGDILIHDDYGYPHLCRLLDKTDGTERCLACESSWRTALRALPPRCPLWEALAPAESKRAQR